MGSIGSSMSPSARMTAASGIARQRATWPSCARSPSTSWGGTEHPGSACGRVASRPPGTMITCSLFWLADFMRRPWEIPGPKGRRLPAGLSGSHGRGRQDRSETLDGESRTDRRTTADDVVRCRLGRDGGRRRAHPGPDLPRRPDASCTGGAITGITSGWDTERQRLEPDAEQSARPVLRGAPDSDVVAPTRRSLTVWFTDEAIRAWAAEPRTTRGGQPWYSALAILTALTLRAVFRLAYRQTEGLIGSLMRLLGLDLPVPDHTTLSRRAATLEVPRPRSSSRAGGEAAPMHLLVDSTGLKLCGPGEWLVEKHGPKARRSWRKLHLGRDADTCEILAATLTPHDVDDGSQVGPLL